MMTNQKMTTKKADISNEIFMKFNLKGAMFIPIELKDGTIHTIDKVYELKALDMKLESEGISLEDFKHIVAIETEKHWNNKTVPDKFGITSWEHFLKDKFAWEIYDRLSIEEYNKKKEYFEKLGIDYSKVSCSCWEEDIRHPKRKFRNYKIINEDVAIADSELKCGGIQLVIKPESMVDKFEWDYTWDLIHKQDEYASEKLKQFKGQIFKNQAELAGEVIYQYIRGFMMGIIISEESKGKTTMTLLGKDSITHINEKGYIKIGKKVIDE